MKQIKRETKINRLPGIKELYFVDIREISEVYIQPSNAVKVILKPFCDWVQVYGKNTTIESSYNKSYTNKITTIINGWDIEEDITPLMASKRFACKFIDKENNAYFLGFNDPLLFTFSYSAPSDVKQWQQITIEFTNDSEFGILKLIE